MAILNLLRKYLSLFSFGLGACLFLVAYTDDKDLDLGLRKNIELIQYVCLTYFLLTLIALAYLRIKNQKKKLSPFITPAKIFSSFIFFAAITWGFIQRDTFMVRGQTFSTMKCWANVLIEECDIAHCPEEAEAKALRQSSCPPQARICNLNYVKEKDGENFRIISRCHMYGVVFLDRVGRTKEELNFTADKELGERVLSTSKELPASF